MLSSIFYLLFILVFLLTNLSSKDLERDIIYLDKFQPYKSTEDSSLNKKILDSILAEKQSTNIQVQKTETSLEEGLKEAAKANAKFYVNGYYTRKPNGNLTLHAIIYDPQTKKAIDAVYVGDVLDEVEDLPLPKEETKLEDESQVKKLSSKLVSRLRFNKNKKVNYENLDELSSSALAKDVSIPIAR